MKKILLSSLLLMSIGDIALAADQPPAKQTAQQVGRDTGQAVNSIKEGGKQAGKAVAKTAVEVGHATRDAAKEVGGKVKETAVEVGHATRDGAKELAKTVKQGTTGSSASAATTHQHKSN